MNNLNHKIILATAFLLLALKLFIFEPSASEFKGFNDLEWETSNGCVNEVLNEIDGHSEGLRLGVGGGDLKQKGHCNTEVFKINSQYARLHYSFINPISDITKFAIAISSDDGLIYKKFKIPYVNNNIWNSIILDLSDYKIENINSKSFNLLVFSNTELEKPTLIIRDRLEFLSEMPQEEKKSNSIFNFINVVRILLPVLVLLVFLYFSQNNLFFLTLILTSLAFHFKWSPFFYFDEWHVMQRFSERSFFDAVLYMHNEHFIPLFFSLYYLEMKLFGGNYQMYLLLSCVLLAIYGYLIKSFLEELSFTSRTSKFLSLLFCASSMHAETLQWSFEQCILISSIFGVLALIYSLRFFKYSKPKDLLKASGCLLLTPLTFGGGFTYLPIILLLGFLYFIFFVYEISFADRIKRLLLAALVLSIITLGPLCLYKNYKDLSAGHAIDETSFFLDKKQFIAYLFQGAGIGSTLRPMGLYPLLSLRSPQEVLQEVLKINFTKIDPYNFIIISAIFSFGLIFILQFYFRDKDINKKHLLFYFLFGVGFIILFFFLPAAGRWKLGANQSLAIRYQCQALLGLLILLAPVFEYFKGESVKGYSKYIAFSILLFWIIIQSFVLDNFVYYQQHGDQDRLYIHAAQQAMGSDGKLKIEKPALLPLHLPDITPGRGMPELVRSFYWLEDE